jgi:NADH-quinone oxidoreductase subunit M
MMTEIFAAHQIGAPILSLILFLPLAAALFVWAVRNDETAKRIALGAMLGVVGLSLILWSRFARGTASFQFTERSDWIGSLGIGYHIGVDGISLLFVILTALLSLFMLVSSWNTIATQVRLYVICLLLLETTTLGVFLSLDLILFFFFWEVMLIPLFFLIKVWGSGNRDSSALKYLLYTLTGSVLMLIGIVILYLNDHAYALSRGITPVYSFDLLRLLHTPLAPSLQFWVFIFLLFGFAVKGPIIPFHTWMPHVLVDSPIAVGVALAGIKLGTYGLLRFSLPLAPVAAQQLAWLVMALALFGVIYGAVIALMQRDLRRLLAYSSISHLGLVAVGLAALNFQGLQGSLLQMINLGVSTSAFFFFIGFLEQRRPGCRIEDLGGVVKQLPVLSVFLFIILFSMLGLPGTNLFIGEFLILLGAFQSWWLYAVIGVLGIILGAAYLLWWAERAMFGQAAPSSVSAHGPAAGDLTGRELVIALPLVIFIFWIGLYPAPFLRVINPSIAAVVQRLQGSVTIVDTKTLAMGGPGGDTASPPDIQ